MRLSIIIIILVTKMALVMWLMTRNDRLWKKYEEYRQQKKKKKQPWGIVIQNISLWMTVIKWRLNNRNGFIRRWTDYKHVDLWGRRSPPLNSLLLDFFLYTFFFFFISRRIVRFFICQRPTYGFRQILTIENCVLFQPQNTCLYMEIAVGARTESYFQSSIVMFCCFVDFERVD